MPGALPRQQLRSGCLDKWSTLRQLKLLKLVHNWPAVFEVWKDIMNKQQLSVSFELLANGFSTATCCCFDSRSEFHMHEVAQHDQLCVGQLTCYELLNTIWKRSAHLWVHQIDWTWCRSYRERERERERFGLSVNWHVCQLFCLCQSFQSTTSTHMKPN